MLLLVDNFDSFTYNLLDYFNQSGAELQVLRNDESDEKLLNNKFKGVVLSPGPGMPQNAGKLMQIVDYYIHKKIPVLGICLGHQAIGVHFGAQLAHTKPMHGKVSDLTLVEPNGSDLKSINLYMGLKKPIRVVRYHSLVLENLPQELVLTALSDRGEIMSFHHQNLPICGIQFHPEAWLTKDGIKMLQNWLAFNKLVY